jgi:hypothetical protein
MTALSKLRSPHWLNWRAARWVALAAAVPALWACNNRTLEAPVPKPQQTYNDLFQQQINRKIDILFMIDNSSSMAALQNKLIAQFPVFTNVLKGLPGGLPDVHIGVISSSMGAGQEQGIANCLVGGDGGRFQFAPTSSATCAKATLNAGQTFISNIGGMANYTGDISDMFSCIALLGQDGCGFEHQFASVLRALGADGSPAPATNNDFLRPDAYLAVILITNEDDCSAPPNTNLFDQTSQLISDPLGPLDSYRCNLYGHLCGGKPPPRLSMMGQEVDLTGTCVSAEDGRELRVADVVTNLKKLKADPTNILVAAIAGPPAPYKVNTVAPQLDDGTNWWPEVEHSCTATDGTNGDPAIRISQWVSAFQGNGVFEDICNDSFMGSLQVIGNLLGRKLGTPCVNGKILDTQGNPWTAADTTAPDCTVIDHTTSASNPAVTVDSPLPQCAGNATTGAAACWHLDDGGPGCATGAHVVGFNRPGAATTTTLNSSVSCSVRACPPAGTPGAPADCP